MLRHKRTLTHTPAQQVALMHIVHQIPIAFVHRLYWRLWACCFPTREEKALDNFYLLDRLLSSLLLDFGIPVKCRLGRKHPKLLDCSRGTQTGGQSVYCYFRFSISIRLVSPNAKQTATFTRTLAPLRLPYRLPSSS